MVKIVKLRDSTYPAQRVDRLSCGMKSSQKSGGNDRIYGKELSNPDVVLHCKDHKLIRAHKLVLASISDVLKIYLVENDKEEDSEIHIILDDMDFEVLNIIMDFAYSGETRVKTTIVDRICEASHRLQIKYLKDSFVKMNRKEFEEMKFKKILNSENKKNSGQVISDPNNSSVCTAKKPKFDRKGKRKANSIENDGPLSKMAKSNSTEEFNIVNGTPTVVKLQRPIMPASSTAVMTQILDVNQTRSKSDNFQTIRSVSPLKPILPATSIPNNILEDNLISSSSSVKTKKIGYSAGPTTPRKVLPKLPIDSNVTAFGSTGPLLVRSGGKLIRLVPSLHSQSPHLNTTQPFVLQRIRQPDGTIVQVLKEVNLTSTQSMQPTTVTPTIVDGDLVSSSNQTKRVILSNPAALRQKSPQIQHSSIIKGSSLSQTEHQYQKCLAPTASNIVINPTQEKATKIECLTSSINPPKLIKLNTNKLSTPTSEPRAIIQPKPSVIQNAMSPKQPIKIQKLTSQMSQVEQNQRHLVKAVSVINQAVEKITRACIQEHSMPSKISATLPEDFLDTGDLDSDKSQYQSKSDPGLKNIQISSSTKSNASSRSSSQSRTTKTDKQEKENAKSSTLENENEKVVQAKATRIVNVRASKKQVERLTSVKKGRTKQKRIPKEDLENAVSSKRPSRSDSKLQKAVIEANTKSTRTNSVKKQIIRTNNSNKCESKPGLRSRSRRK